MSEANSNFFYTPGLKYLVQQLVHLAFFGDGLSVVSGKSGSGKTALAEELMGQFELAHDVKMISLEQPSELSENIEKISSELGINSEDSLSAGEMLADLRHFVQDLLHDQKQIVLIIDGANFLDDQSIGALVSLMQGKPEENYGLHLIFLAEPGFDNRIDALQIIDVAVYDFQIPNFSPTELANFLAGYSPEGALLADQQVKKLWAGSMGLPGLALSQLRAADDSKSSSSGKHPKFRFGIPYGHIAAVSVLALVLLVSLIFYNEKDDSGKMVNAQGLSEFVASADDLPPQQTFKDESLLPGTSKLNQEKTPAELDSQLANEIASSVAESEKSSGEDTTHSSSDVDPRRLAENSDAEIADSIQDGGSKKTVQGMADTGKSKTLGQKSIGSEGDLGFESLPTPLVTSSAFSSEESKKKHTVLPTPRAQTPLKSLSESEVFILAQNPNDYTLQVVAASKRPSLDAYMSRQANKDSLKMYRGTREGKSWFVVIQGVYSSRAAAIAAIKKLPHEQAKTGPWPRKLSAIQEEIENFRVKVD